MKLSIALTTYNHEKYIAEAIESILNQNVTCDYEIVIGNDFSTDNTQLIIEHYKSKYPEIIKILPRNHNLGYVRNFDETIKACLGEYISIFDGDDIMLPSKLQKQIEFLDKNQNCVIVGHDARAFYSDTKKTARIISPTHKKDFYDLPYLIKYGSFFANSSKMFRKSAYPQEGIDYNVKMIADWYMTLEIARKGTIGYIHEVLVEYRIHESSIMQTIKGDVHFNDKIYIINKFEEYYPKKYTNLFKRQLAYAFLAKGIFEFQNNNTKAARKNFIKSIKSYYFYSLSPYFRYLLTFFPKKVYYLFLKFFNRNH